MGSYIYIYKERERERERWSEIGSRLALCKFK